MTCRKPQATPQFARQREWASHAEEIPGCQQRHHEDRAAVRPGEHAGKIHRRHRVAEETVRDDRNGKNQQDRLQRPASVAGAEQRTGNRCSQKIKCDEKGALRAAACKALTDRSRLTIEGSSSRTVTITAALSKMNEPKTHMMAPAVT